MKYYQDMINSLTAVIVEGTEKKRNYILAGDNSSGKSDVLRSVIDAKKRRNVYFIDSVNRTFDPDKVELMSQAYKNINLEPDYVLRDRMAPNHFNVQDSFIAIGSIERLYLRYCDKLKILFRLFLKADIEITRVNLEGGFTENRVLINGNAVSLSSGFQAVMRLFTELLYFCDIMKANDWQQGLVVVDELDEYLSPRNSSQILNFLQEEFSSLNYLVTTHSIDLVKNSENINFIILKGTEFEIYSCDELKGTVGAEAIFVDLYFKENVYHNTDNDVLDESLRRLFNIKIADEWDSSAEQTWQEIDDGKLLPHQKLIYKQIKEW